jgi:hypothetical protein
MKDPLHLHVSFPKWREGPVDGYNESLTIIWWVLYRVPVLPTGRKYILDWMFYKEQENVNIINAFMLHSQKNMATIFFFQNCVSKSNFLLILFLSLVNKCYTFLTFKYTTSIKSMLQPINYCHYCGLFY